VNGNPDVWSDLLVGNILSVLMMLIKGCSWESNLGTVWNERLLGSWPVKSVDHSVGHALNFFVDVFLGNVSTVSSSLVKGWWESHLGTVWNEWLLRSWPVKSIDHGVGHTLNFCVDILLRNISTVSLMKRGWEGNLGTVGDKWLFRSWPVESIDHSISHTLDFFVDVFLGYVSSVSPSLVERWWESHL